MVSTAKLACSKLKIPEQYKWHWLTKDVEAKSLVEVLHAKDFVLSTFRVAINKCQQVALDVASAKLPCPEDQLDQIRQRREKTKDHSSKLSLTLQVLDGFPQIVLNGHHPEPSG